MRAVEEWTGKTDDSVAPPRIRLRVFERCKGRCGICDRVIHAGERWTLEHVIAICNGGPNCESNMDITCCNCLAAKNAADVAEKSKVARTAKKHKLPKEPSKWGCGKGSKFKKKLNGQTVLRG
jgi:5-methylcytosine-specific restriction endonuclease McrA